MARVTTAEAFQALSDMINEDPDYAWSWHCNLAVPIMDVAMMPNELANEAAALIMAQMFGHDITKHPNYRFEKSGAQAYFEIRVASERTE